MIEQNLTAVGLYSISEAARLLGQKRNLVKNWTTGYSSKWSGEKSEHPQVIIPQHPEDDEFILGFLNLIELKLIFSLREKLSLQAIRSLYLQARELLKKDYPFACEDFYYDENGKLFADLVKRVQELVTHEDEEHLLIELKNNQIVIRDIIIKDLKPVIAFNGGLASKWYPMGYNMFDVVIDPSIEYGMPVVTPSNIQTRYIYDTYQRQGSVEYSAWWHRVSDKEVKAAIAYESQFKKVA